MKTIRTLTAILATAQAVALLLTAGGLAQAQDRAPQIYAVPVPGGQERVTPGEDGALWSVSTTWVGDRSVTSIVRVGFDGVRSRAPLGPPASSSDVMLVARSRFFPVAHGGMALVVARWNRATDRTLAVWLLRFRANGTLWQRFALPRAARRARAFALTRRATLWFGAACADRVYRWRSETPLVRIALGRLGCRYPEMSEQTSEIALSPDGTVWFANADQGRAVRIRASRVMRSWRWSASEGGDPWLVPGGISLDGRGGIVLRAPQSLSVVPNACTLRITPRGRLVRLAAQRPCIVDRKGRLWQLFDDRVVERDLATGTSRSLPGPPGLLLGALIELADGRVAYLAGTLDDNLADSHHTPIWRNLVIGTAGEQELGPSWSLAAQNAPGVQLENGSWLQPELGFDGAVWLRAFAAQDEGGPFAGYARVVLPPAALP